MYIMSGSGGFRCIVKGCKSSTKLKNIKMFRIVKDSEIARMWLIAGNREDLLSKNSLDLYNNYKICCKHFESSMYTSPEQNRLLPRAVPTIFPQLEGCCSSLKRVHEDEHLVNSNKKRKISSDIMVPTKNTQPADQACLTPVTPEVLDPLFVDVEALSTCSSTSPLASPASSPTPASRSASTPREMELRSQLKETKRLLSAMKRPLNIDERHESLELFDLLCQMFLPESLAKFVKIQSRRRYSSE